jgi:hypothetical protein
MTNPNTDTRRTRVEKKLRKKVGDEIVETLMGLNEAELEERLTRLAAHESETEAALEEDAVVADLKDRLAAARGPYTDTLKGIKLQRNFIALVLADRGKPMPI